MPPSLILYRVSHIRGRFVGHGGADGEEWNVRGVKEVGVLERPFLVRGEIAVARG